MTRIEKVSAKKTLVALAASFAVCLLWSVEPAAAQAIDIQLPSAEAWGLPTNDLREIIANLVRSFLGLMGMVMVLMILWSGFKMMTHGGNEDARNEAVGGIKNAVIGLFIMLASFSAAKFIIETVSEATGIMS
jgi:fumarate reductase subunit D